MPCSSQAVLRRRTPATLLSILALGCVSPAAALAQSAGDEQYRDPLAGQKQSGGNSGGGNNSGGNSSGTQGTTTQQPQGTTTQQQGTTSQGTTTTTPQATASATKGGPTLPRTGSDAVIPFAALGSTMLLGGFALRRRTRPGRLGA